MSTKAIIFDCYGVLYVDSHRSLKQEYPDLAQDIADLSQQSDYGWIDREQYLEELSRLTGESTSFITEFILTEHHLNKALVATIAELKTQYKIGMVSNVGRGWLEDFFTQHNLRHLFNVIVLSGEEGITKPNPDIFTLAAERLGVETGECIMIDDIQDNCNGADAAGMRSVHYRSNTQLTSDLQALLESDTQTM
ncbi:HAD family hydrolase [Candidatus Saccharibacteria bacterium]|nr:MAG: HAD family hydrolase [Candidatus Saccharibacteria bacterium]